MKGNEYMATERVDYYSEEEYQQTLEWNYQQQLDEQREYMEMQSMYFDNQLGC